MVITTRKIIMKKLLVILSFIFIANVQASTDSHAEDRKALRVILADMVVALNAHDFDLATKHLDPKGVITYYNAEVTVGHKQSREYFNRMLKETNALVKEYSLTGDVSAPAIFHGNTAIAYGITEEHFKLAEGLEFTLNGHWTSTMHKTNGVWKIVNLHFSTNLFDNPLLTIAERLQWIIGIVAFIVGLILMFVLMKLTRKK